MLRADRSGLNRRRSGVVVRILMYSRDSVWTATEILTGP